MTAFRRNAQSPPDKTSWHKPLGDLEQAVVDVVWAHGTIGSPEVQAALAPERHLALTTVVTTLDRLHKKGILRRERVGKGYQYAATITRPELEQQIVQGVLQELMTEYPEALTSLLEEGSLLDSMTHARLASRLRKAKGEAENDE